MLTSPAFAVALEVVLALWAAGLAFITIWLIVKHRQAEQAKKRDAAELRRVYGDVYEVTE